MASSQTGAQMNIANGIREFARATPKRTAIIDGDRTLTYEALNDRANRLANRLLSSDLNPGDHVAILLGNRLEYPELAAGVAKAGMISVPLNPRSAAPELDFIIGHSEARALILDDTLANNAALAVENQSIETVLSLSGTQLGTAYEEALSTAQSSDPSIPIAETEPFAIAYTSGTTGDPKGVIISHRSRCLTFLCTALEWGLGPGRRTIAVAPMYHGAGFAFAYAALHTGGTVSMLRSFDPEHLLTMVEKDRPQSVFLVPTHANFIRALGENRISEFDTSSLEILYFNAAPFPQEMKLWTLETFPHVGLHELYGSTEASIVTDLRPEDQRRKERCVGPPWFMTEVRLVDDDGNHVEPGEVGELYSRSPFLMDGYYKNPTATASSTTDDGFFSAGDLAVMDDEGYFYVVDRKKDMIISGGANVYPREVEEVLIEHPDVVDVAVIGRPSEEWGEAVSAIVVLRSGADLDEAALEEHCRRSLAGFRIPRSYMAVEALPRNAAGKILKRELRLHDDG